MRAPALYFAKLLFCLIPETRLFTTKAWLLRLAGAKMIKNVRICSSATILGPGFLELGDDTWVGHQVLIIAGSRVTIGKAVDIAPRVYLGTGTHDIDSAKAHSAGEGRNKDVVVEDGAWLGAACMILPGVTIGAKSVVAAGAVVAKDVPPRTLVGGVPARVIGPFRS